MKTISYREKLEKRIAKLKELQRDEISEGKKAEEALKAHYNEHKHKFESAVESPDLKEIVEQGNSLSFDATFHFSNAEEIEEQIRSSEATLRRL